MEAWEKDYPESTFAKVMESVNNAISTSKPFLECIPDSPFPARSVILGLAHLLQLGAVRIFLLFFMHLALTTPYEGNRDCKERSVRLYDASLDLVLYRRGVISNGEEEEICGPS